MSIRYDDARICIRPGELRDIPAFQALEATAFIDPWSRAGLESELTQKVSRTWLLELDGEPVATLMGWSMFGELQINRVAVRPDLRGQGLGRRIVQHALEQSRAEQVTVALLEVRFGNDAAVGLYESLGFERTGLRKRYYSDGTDDVLMRKELDPKPMLRPGLYAILDADRLGWLDGPTLERNLSQLLDYGRAAVEAGACAVQLRAKSLPNGDPARIRVYAALLQACGAHVPTVLNDEVDGLAGLTNLPGAGLHLGQQDTPAEVARQAVGPLTLLGLSTHDVAQVQAAAGRPVDYIGFGPIHATVGKRGHDAVVGVDGLRQVVTHARVPVVAIGGITAQDLQPVRNAGAHAAAVIGAWLGPAGQPWSPARAGAALRDLVAVWSRPENTP